MPSTHGRTLATPDCKGHTSGRPSERRQQEAVRRWRAVPVPTTAYPTMVRVAATDCWGRRTGVSQVRFVHQGPHSRSRDSMATPDGLTLSMLYHPPLPCTPTPPLARRRGEADPRQVPGAWCGMLLPLLLLHDACRGHAGRQRAVRRCCLSPLLLPSLPTPCLNCPCACPPHFF